MTRQDRADSPAEPPRDEPDTTRGGRGSRRGAAARKGRKTRWASLREILVVVLLAVLIAFVVKTLFIRGFYIPSGSMENTLELNDRIFVNVMDAKLDHLERGDIVVFDDTQGWLPAQPQRAGGAAGAVRKALAFVGVVPDSGEQALVKRVIGVGGDHVTCCDASGRVSVNGAALDEPYLYPGAVPSETAFDVVVPQDHFFVMGDHRNASADSRAHLATGTAFIDKRDVVGTAFVIAWPLDRFQLLHNPEQVFADVPAPGSGKH